MNETMTVVRNAMRGAAAVALAALVLATASFAKDKAENQEPQAWGMQSGNSGCVIFKESEQINSVMAPGGGAFTTQTVKTLEVIDAIHATLPHKKYTETKKELDALQQLSMENHLKYVKIPKKYAPEDLAKAKGICGVQ
jgi:hypothetical protein